MDDDAARARDRLLLAGVGPAAVSLAAPLDLDAGRDLAVRLIFEVPTTLCEVDAVGVGGWATFATGLRPSPSSFAKIERARNMLEPSGDDCSVTPTAGGIHPRSSRVARLCAELVFFPGSRNQDKSHSPDGRNGAPTQRE